MRGVCAVDADENEDEEGEEKNEGVWFSLLVSLFGVMENSPKEVDDDDDCLIGKGTGKARHI